MSAHLIVPQKEPVYITPTSRIILLDIEHSVCNSPVPGGNEDIGYEEL